MAAEIIGNVISGRLRKTYQVKWDQYSRQVYINYAGWTNVGSASSAREAMNKAEAWLYDK